MIQDSNGLHNFHGNPHREHPHKRWAIVLSGGDGSRMRSFVEGWLATPRPKQYCRFTGNKTMLQHTLNRAKQCVSEENIVLVVSRNHFPYLESEGLSHFKGRIIEETCKKGTACAVFFALSCILQEDPHAEIAVFPADHFIHPINFFVQTVKEVFNYVCESPERVFLLGAVPSSLELDYGWILPRSEANELFDSNPKKYPAYEVDKFFEKPHRYYAEWLYCSGGLWNTMITLSKAQTLWDLGQHSLGKWMHAFQSAQFKKHEHDQEKTKTNIRIDLQHDNSQIQPCDFSSDFLSPIASHCSVIPMHNILWSDWGRPERLFATLRETGLKPAFPRLSEKLHGTGREPFIRYKHVSLAAS